MKRKIRLHQGNSPGDIVVFSRAVSDLAIQYPDFNISIDSPCPAVFESNPYVNKTTIKKPNIKPYADNLAKVGFDLNRIATDYLGIFTELVSKNNLEANKIKNTFYYSLGGLRLFSSKINLARKKVEEFDIHYDEYEPGISQSGLSGLHFSRAFYSDLEAQLGVKIKQTSLLPALFLTEEEKGWTNQVEQELNYRGKFWLVNAGHKNDYPLKQWGYDYWQELVNLLKDKIQFVQIGEVGDNHNHPKLENVISMLGKTDLRQLIRLSYHAQGAVSHVSLLHHLMAAWKKPCVTIAGGREPRRWESYPSHRYLDTNGQLKCCGYDGCWQSGRMETTEKGEENKTCKNMVGNQPKCMRMIKPEFVAKEIMDYYYGGVLQF